MLGWMAAVCGALGPASGVFIMYLDRGDPFGFGGMIGLAFWVFGNMIGGTLRAIAWRLPVSSVPRGTQTVLIRARTECARRRPPCLHQRAPLNTDHLGSRQLNLSRFPALVLPAVADAPQADAAEALCALAARSWAATAK